MAMIRVYEIKLIDKGERMFIKSFEEVQNEVHEIAKDKGWWDQDRNDGELICLMHSELSEALEALRKGNPADEKIPEFTSEEAELADTIIRIMDYAGKKKLRLAGAIIAKKNMNKTRSHKHGGKLF
jgi:hypothetical protein